MPLTLEQLRDPVSEDEALEFLITELASLGFNATSWQSGSVQRTMVQMFARVYSTLTTTVDTLSRIAFNDTSEGSALTAFSDSHYDNQRIAAVSTEGNITLTGAAIGPPHAITAGQLVFSDADGRTFRNLNAGIVPASGTLVITAQAETPGTGGNVPNGTILTMNTPLAGVTCSNDAIAPAITWITADGVDEETDASLKERNRTRWSTLSPSDPAARYEYFIRTAVPAAARVEIDDSNPLGPGTVAIYIAGASGVSAAADVVDAQTEADRIKNPTADITVSGAVAQPQAFVYTAFITSALNNAITQSAVEQALRDYVNTLPISGSLFPPFIPPIGEFVHSEAIGAMTAIEGVLQVQLTTPPANVPITPHNVMTVASVTASYIDV